MLRLRVSECVCVTMERRKEKEVSMGILLYTAKGARNANYGEEQGYGKMKERRALEDGIKRPGPP